MCPEINATCKGRKKTGHLANIPAWRAKGVDCIKVKDIHSPKSTNIVRVKACGPKTSIPVGIKADTGANITVMNYQVNKAIWYNGSCTNENRSFGAGTRINRDMDMRDAYYQIYGQKWSYLLYG